MTDINEFGLESALLSTPDERIGASGTARAMAEHREGMHSCRETDSCMCLNCQMRCNGLPHSYYILHTNCPLCRLDLMNFVPAGNDFQPKF